MPTSIFTAGGLLVVVLHATWLIARLKELDDAAMALAAAAGSEASLRVCGRLAAARRNLDAAAAWIAGSHPDLDLAAREAARRLADDLAGRYPPGLRPDALGTCPVTWIVELDAPSPAGIRLHRERGQGQPSDWPNWVARLVAVRQ